jgi:hypothetical protein
MTRLLIGLTGGLYTFDLVANCGPGPGLSGVQPIAFAMDPSEPARVYCATYNRGLWRSEDAGETWLPVGTPQGFFEGPTDGAIEPRETTFVSVDPIAQADGRHAVWSARNRAAYTVPQIMATRSNSCPLSTCRPAVVGPFLHGRELTMSSASPTPATVACIWLSKPAP